jgi:AraC family transcriptional regulator of adaptative response/methylated-DNA-[protein]-cysteine methyltransferase
MTAQPRMISPVEQLPSPDLLWDAVTRRDGAWDGRFVYGVRTTGVYCRPSCPARLARRENVSFHATTEQARESGLRACKRCNPDGEDPRARREALVAAACRAIEEAEEAPRLEDLAASAGLSPFHFHRVFRSITGLTPAAWAAAHKGRRVRESLGKGAGVTEALYDAGFNSSSRFYEKATSMLGMKPSAYRDGGRGEEIRFAVGQCSLGAILVAATGAGLCAITMGEDPEALVRDLQDRFPKARLVGGDATFERTVAAVVAFVEEPGRGLELPLDIRGTAFQQRVWDALRSIPAGETVTYTDIAARLGRPEAVRAVAGACAANAIAVAIPCHRVVRRDGDLSGYRWGIERKAELLRREGAPSPALRDKAARTAG